MGREGCGWGGREADGEGGRGVGREGGFHTHVCCVGTLFLILDVTPWMTWALSSLPSRCLPLCLCVSVPLLSE